jgi:hypothetical protein
MRPTPQKARQSIAPDLGRCRSSPASSRSNNPRIEVLFDVSLKQDPLRLLQGLSRNKTVVAAWSGSIDGEHMVYATPDHSEYKRYPIRDSPVVNPEVAA